VYDGRQEEVETGKAIEDALTHEPFDQRMQATAEETD
jgi:hypothetical protein